jgi:hypothetical protein
MATSTQIDSGVGAPKTTAGELLKALNHPIRRSILRFLQNTAQASSTEIRRAIPIGNNLSHHLEILVITGAVTRGPKPMNLRANVYSPEEATQARWFQTALQLTAAED